eukprot:scaffold2173_cov106-Alexandrium_tamarense.AAC.1
MESSSYHLFIVVHPSTAYHTSIVAHHARHTHTPSRPSSSRTATQQHFCFTSQTDEVYSCSQAFVQIAATTSVRRERPSRRRPSFVWSATTK